MSINRTMAGLHKTIAEERSAFHLRFGRAPVEGDPIIFDRDAEGSEPQPLLGEELYEHMTEISKQVGLPHDTVYALHRLHRLPADQRSFDLHQQTLSEYLHEKLVPAWCAKRGIALGI